MQLGHWLVLKQGLSKLHPGAKVPHFLGSVSALHCVSHAVLTYTSTHTRTHTAWSCVPDLTQIHLHITLCTTNLQAGDQGHPPKTHSFWFGHTQALSQSAKHHRCITDASHSSRGIFMLRLRKEALVISQAAHTNRNASCTSSMAQHCVSFIST